MKIGRNIALMAIGAGAVMAYQKYKKPAMRKLEKVVDKTRDKTNNMLDNMM